MLQVSLNSKRARAVAVDLQNQSRWLNVVPHVDLKEAAEQAGDLWFVCLSHSESN